MYYILEGKTPVPVECEKWSEWFATASRRVALYKTKKYTISTVFLGINHGTDKKPILFETMIFKGGNNMEDLFCARYSTWAEAKENHDKLVSLLIEGRLDFLG